MEEELLQGKTNISNVPVMIDCQYGKQIINKVVCGNTYTAFLTCI